MADVRLSRSAERDLLDVYVYGIEQFGEAQAENYHVDLNRCFDLLAMHPNMGRSAEIIATGVRRHEHGSHVILYEAASDGVLILAIVHRRSIPRLRL